MRIVFVGSSGHSDYAFGGLEGDAEAKIVGLAPGVPGEEVTGIRMQAESLGHKPKSYDNHLEMLEEQAPDIAVINTRFDRQASVAIEAMERGIHVFVEKPVATELADLDSVGAAQEGSGVHLAAMLGLRYDPAFFTAWQNVKAGRIGDVRLIHAQKSYKLGRRKEFYTRRETYGGTIPWVGIHAIDWLRWFAGAEALSVYATHSRIGNDGHGELETSGICQFEFPDEVYGSCSIDYLRPARASSHGDDRIRVAGSRGIVEVRDGTALLLGADAAETEELPLENPGSFFGDFLRQCRGEGSCRVTVTDSIESTRSALLARESADTGRRIEFAPTRPEPGLR